jgi:hypothetical protein
MSSKHSKLQIEHWVLSLIDRVVKHEPVEDAREELKAIWPTDQLKTARQIAGMANAARGEEFLWVIGLDETTGVIGALQQELANWWPSVAANFDGIAPTFTDLNVPAGGRTVVALLFESDRSPFVVKTSTDRLEIPWRTGKRTHSADRSQIIKLLYPLQKLPVIQLLNARVQVHKHDNSFHQWTITLHLYVAPPADATTAILIGKVHGSIKVPELNMAGTWRTNVVYAEGADSNHEVAKHMVCLSKPEVVCFHGYWNPDKPCHEAISPVSIDFEISPEDADRPICVHGDLTLSNAREFTSNCVKTWSVLPWDGGQDEFLRGTARRVRR